jgi:hypothetical protein
MVLPSSMKGLYRSSQSRPPEKPSRLNAPQRSNIWISCITFGVLRTSTVIGGVVVVGEMNPKLFFFAALKSRSMFSIVLFSLTLSPTNFQVTPFSLRKSFCGSMISTAVSFLLISMVHLLFTGSDS